MPRASKPPAARPVGALAPLLVPPAETVERALALLDTLFATASVGIAFVDADLRFVRVNDRLAVMSGLPADAHVGRHAGEVLPEAGTQVLPHLREVLRTRRPLLDVAVQAETPRMPGTRRHWCLSYHPVLTVAGELLGVVVIVDETTAREDLLRAERAAREHAEASAERLRRLQALTTALTSTVTREAVGRTTLEVGVLAVGACAGVLVVPVFGGAEVEILSSVGYANCMLAGQRWPIGTAMPIVDAVRTGEPVFLGSPAAWRERYPGGKTATSATSRAWAALPLVLDRDPIGGLLWTYDTPREFSPEECELLEAIAGQCAQALERARLYEAERAARAAAEAANQAKTQFLAVMSHELRTPLNAIQGYAELIEMGVRGPISEQQRDDLRRIQRSGRHLLSLINDVLNFAKLEAGHVEYHPADVPLDALLADLETLVAPQMSERRLTFLVRRDGPGLVAHADPEKLRQVLLNLLSNAIKFTEPGGTVAVDCEAREEWVVVRVRDTGRGIPEEQLDRVFEPFVQLDRRLASGGEGTGLGLAISRDLARGMGGDLTATSRAGEGSEFVVKLVKGGAGSGA